MGLGCEVWVGGVCQWFCGHLLKFGGRFRSRKSFRENPNPKVDAYMNCFSHAEACVQLVCRDEEIQTLTRQVRVLKRLRAQSQQVVALMSKKRDSLAASLAALEKKAKYRRGFAAHVHPWAGYALALKTNQGHTSASVTTSMVAGDEHQGQVQDKKTVWLYEHRAACAKRLRSKLRYDGLNDPGDADMRSCCETHLIKSDASTHEAVDRAKVHMSLVQSTWIPSRQPVDRVDDWELAASRICAAGDLQKVVEGTAAANYWMIKREFESVGCPTWIDRIGEARARPDRTTVFIFGCDGGGENTGMAPLLRRDFGILPNVSYVIDVCFFHSVHLIVGDALDLIDRWQWPEPHALEPRYYSALATTVNVWRSTGIYTKIKTAARETFPDCHLLDKVPGRCLKNRWGSVDSIERLLVSARSVVGKVFEIAVGPLIKKIRRRVKGPAGGEEEYYQEQQRNYRATAVAATSSDVFLATAMISLTCKSVLHHFLLWGQKQVQDMNRLISEANKSGKTFWGPTALSNFACGEAEKMMTQIHDLIDEEKIDTQRTWEPLWALLPEHLHKSGRALILTTVLMVAAAWDYRIMQRTRSLPLRLLRMLESPPDVDCQERREISSCVLSSQDCCLDSKMSNLAANWKHHFQKELEIAKRTGTCPPRLWAALLTLRSNWPLENQEVEGMASLCQIMVRAAPSSGHAIIGDRLQIKKADPISAAVCEGLHPMVMKSMQSREHASRFAPICDGDAPAPAPIVGEDGEEVAAGNARKPCQHMVTAEFITAPAC